MMIAASFWLIAVVAVMGSLVAYSNAPGNPRATFTIELPLNGPGVSNN